MIIIETILGGIFIIGMIFAGSLIFLIPNFSFKRKITNKTYEEKTEIYNKWKNNELKYILLYSLIPLFLSIYRIVSTDSFDAVAILYLLTPILFYINVKQIYIDEEYKIHYLENILMFFVLAIIAMFIQFFINLSSV